MKPSALTPRLFLFALALWLVANPIKSVAQETPVALRGLVHTQQGEPLSGAVVTLSPGNHRAQTDDDGAFAFEDIEPGEMTLQATHPRNRQGISIRLETIPGERLQVHLPIERKRDAPPFRFRMMTPDEDHAPDRAFVHVGGQTNPQNGVMINGEAVHVYDTGIFVRDNIPLDVGRNAIRITVYTPDNLSVTRIRTLRRVPVSQAAPSLPESPLQIAQGSIEPEANHWLQPGDLLTFRFQGAPNAQAFAVIGSSEKRYALAERPAEDAGAAGIYTGAIQIPANADWKQASLTLILERGEQQVSAIAPGRITVLNAGYPRVAQVKRDHTELKVGLGQVRLGGPIFTTVDEGTRLPISGKVGAMWRVSLTETQQAWVHESAVELLPVGTQPPRGYITTVQVSGDETTDVIQIPNREQAPYRVYAHHDPAGIWIDLYGLTSNTTWLVQDPKALGIKNVLWQQAEKDLYRLKVRLHSAQVWGYTVSSTQNYLTVRVKRPPRYSRSSPLRGLTIAVEAGHGGRNTGAQGLSGSLEKKVNRAAADRLQQMLEEAGAEVIEMRQDDETISLEDRTQRAIDANADLMISIHANAASTRRGYLRVSGASTYYNTLFSRPLAKQVLDELLQLDLDSFGLVGHFNYRPIRVTEMPAILVEQAFMTHPGDEEKLLDPAFQTEIARAIKEGLIQFLQSAHPDAP